MDEFKSVPDTSDMKCWVWEQLRNTVEVIYNSPRISTAFMYYVSSD